MNKKEFEATYRNMLDEQLLELTTQMADLVPEATVALRAELTSRGKSQAEIEQYSTDKKKGTVSVAPVADASLEEHALGEEQALTYLREGDVPANWVNIPSFGIDESLLAAECMEACCIPFYIVKNQGCDCQQCHLAVSRENLKESVAALKEAFGLTDELPEPFTGDCPACGTPLNRAAICSGCDLNFVQDQWEARSKHPFTRFLIENGFGRKPA